jgi:iron complex transport system ATP-binding protein
MADAPTAAAIEASGLAKSFGPGAFGLEGIDLEIKRGEVFGIIGPNGSGKTTLLRTMAGILRPDRGALSLLGRPLASYGSLERARRLAYVPQESALTFPFTVQEVVLMGRYPYLGRLGFESRQDLEAARWALAVTETERFKGRLMAELSGGERQRVIIAMALAQEPDVLLLDEPTSFLDIKHQVKIQSLLVRLKEEKGLTVVSALHDLTMASTYFDRLCLLTGGRTVRIGPPSEVIEYQLIKDAYGTEVYIDINTVTGRPYIIPLCDASPQGKNDAKPEGEAN